MIRTFFILCNLPRTHIVSWRLDEDLVVKCVGFFKHYLCTMMIIIQTDSLEVAKFAFVFNFYIVFTDSVHMHLSHPWGPFITVTIIIICLRSCLVARTGS